MVTLRQIMTVAAIAMIPAAARAGDDQPLIVGALGDSISAGFDAVRLGDNREMSWSTGDSTEVKSHAQRLAQQTNRPVTTFNEAIAGSVVTDLDQQVERLLPHKPDYITIDIGANDLCTWPSDYTAQLGAYEGHLHDLVNQIVTALPQSKVVLAPIPNLYNLWQVASPQPGCQERWDLIGICTPLLGSNVSDADRQAFTVRWQLANAAIDRIAASFPANVLHDPNGANTRFEWQHVSTVDCFHPSVAGQNLLSEVAWKLLEPGN